MMLNLQDMDWERYWKSLPVSAEHVANKRGVKFTGTAKAKRAAKKRRRIKALQSKR